MKYSFDEKLKAVKQHLENGSCLYPEQCDTKGKKKTYLNQVKFWEAQYLLKGEEGIRHPEKNRKYSAEEKYEIIRPVILYEISLMQQSRNTGMNQGLLVSWIKKYKEKGMDGLKCSRRGRKKDMKPIEEVKKETEKQPSGTDEEEKSPEELKKEIQDLKQQNLILQAEIEYRKKLQALAEEKARWKRMRKQRSYADSSKANSSEGK